MMVCVAAKTPFPTANDTDNRVGMAKGLAATVSASYCLEKEIQLKEGGSNKLESLKTDAFNEHPK